MVNRPDTKRDPDKVVEIAKRFVSDQKEIIERLENNPGVTEKKEIEFLKETVVRRTLRVLLDGGYNVPESSMATYVSFLQIPSMRCAVEKVLGY